MNYLDLIKVIILGIIEGITEWLPISSTGHLIIVENIMNIENSLSPEFLEMFRVVIQLGAVMAVVVLFWNKLFPFSFKKGFKVKQETMTLWYKIVVACVPAGIIGILFDDMIDKYLYNYQVVALTLILYGILFIVVENKNRGKRFRINELSEIDYKTALLIGIFQVLALIPGTSRSGSTIIGGMLLGASRTVSAEFTFFLAIPIMFGASLLKIIKFGFNFTAAELSLLLVGMAVAFVVSIFAIRYLMNFIKKHDFKVFGWYRIVLGAIVIIYFLATSSKILS